MKARKLLFVFFVALLVLAACGGGKEDGKPVEVVKKVVEAMETLDIKEASKYFCKEKRDELESSLESGFEELESLGMEADELLSAFKINMSDMKYEEKSKEDEKAIVQVSGNIALDFDTDKLREVVKKAAEAAGEQITDAQLDMAMGMFTAMVGQEAPIQGDVEVIKEDGDWVVCDELDFLDQVDLGF